MTTETTTTTTATTTTTTATTTTETTTTDNLVTIAGTGKTKSIPHTHGLWRTDKGVSSDSIDNSSRDNSSSVNISSSSVNISSSRDNSSSSNTDRSKSNNNSTSTNHQLPSPITPTPTQQLTPAPREAHRSTNITASFYSNSDLYRRSPGHRADESLWHQSIRTTGEGLQRHTVHSRKWTRSIKLRNHAPRLRPFATATAAPEPSATMALLRVLVFDPEGRPVAFDTWHDDLQLYLLSDLKDSVSLFDHVSGVAPAPPATADVSTRSQWLSRDATARLAIRNHLHATECAHFGEHRTA
ncbi:unnamed protein product [Closterium sp. NIES-54]